MCVNEYAIRQNLISMREGAGNDIISKVNSAMCTKGDEMWGQEQVLDFQIYKNKWCYAVI